MNEGTFSPHTSLPSLNQLKEDKKQKSWDTYFLNLTNEIAKKSKCMSRKVGAIIVRDNSIISTGYNGAARGVKECNERTNIFYCKLEFGDELWQRLDYNYKKIEECPRKKIGYSSGVGLHLCQASHAEANAIVQSARMGHPTKDATIYINLNPCKNCVALIINSGIKRVVYPKPEKHYDKYAQILLKESKIEVKEMEL